ncbi:MAG: hypothetical protein AAGF10_07170, partial [Verrucomicrobiota bacterium]
YTTEKGHLELARQMDTAPESVSSLLTKDPAARYPLYVDSHKFIIDLGDYWMINMFEFANYGAQGRAQVFYSDALQEPGSRQWKPASPIVPYSGEGTIPLFLGTLDARYLMLVLDNSIRGEIGPFCVYGDLKLGQVRMADGGLSPLEFQQLPAAERKQYRPVNYDWASVQSGTRVSHISSGDPAQGNTILDNDPRTNHAFGNEPESLMVIDLAQSRSTQRMSLSVNSPPGRFDIYVVQDLPESFKPRALPALTEADDVAAPSEKSVRPPSARLPQDFFSLAQPHATHTTAGGKTDLRLDFEATRGRWVILRYQRSDADGYSQYTQPDAGSLVPVKIFPMGFAFSPVNLLSQSDGDGSSGGGLVINGMSISGDFFVNGPPMVPDSSFGLGNGGDMGGGARSGGGSSDGGEDGGEGSEGGDSAGTGSSSGLSGMGGSLRDPEEVNQTNSAPETQEGVSP